jgi:hypothetical protein
VLENEELYILATGDSTHIDQSDRGLDKMGTGFRKAKTGNIIDKFSDNIDGKEMIPSGRNMVSVSFDDRPSDLTNIKSTGGLFTANPYRDASMVTEHMGNVLQLKWEYSNPNLLHPGMPVRVLYKYLGTAYSLNGIILGASTHVTSPLPSILDKRYKSDTTLTLFIERVVR